MTEFQFNTMTTTNRIMAYANQKHALAVEEARRRPIVREAAREYRKFRNERRLDAALMIASMTGIAMAIWFLTAIGAM